MYGSELTPLQNRLLDCGVVTSSSGQTISCFLFMMIEMSRSTLYLSEGTFSTLSATIIHSRMWLAGAGETSTL